MRFLSEAYDVEEIKQRISDSKVIMESLSDSLYILVSALESAESHKELNEKLARYARGFIRDLDDMIIDFNNDFEEYILDEVGDEEDIDIYNDGFEDEIDIEVDEAFQPKPWNARYKGFKIRMDRNNPCYNIYDSENELVDSGFTSLAACKDAIDRNENNLFEDTEKNSKGKWVNRGDTGKTHGEFKTKKEADAQRRAIFANWKK